MEIENEGTKPYRLKHGHNHFHDGALVEGGGVVHLTDAQYASFKDKFVKEGDPLPPPPATEESVDEEDDDTENEGGSEGDGDDEEDEDDEDGTGDEAAGTGEPLIEGEESPIVKRRREKAEKKAARKAGRK